MKKVFISYRREDSAAMAGRIYDSLCARFGEVNVFFDVDTLAGGEEFKPKIEACLVETGVLLVVMDVEWHSILLQRSKDPQTDDFVILEIDTASRQGIPDSAPVPVSEKGRLEFERFVNSNVPLAKVLAAHQAIEIDRGKDYRNHVDRLIRDIEKVLKISKSTEASCRRNRIHDHASRSHGLWRFAVRLRQASQWIA